jgi:hypothetical protein
MLSSQRLYYGGALMDQEGHHPKAFPLQSTPHPHFDVRYLGVGQGDPGPQTNAGHPEVTLMSSGYCFYVIDCWDVIGDTGDKDACHWGACD